MSRRTCKSSTRGWMGRLVAVLVCGILLAACDSDSSDADSESITGTWSGTLGTQTVEMTLTETPSPVSGSSVAGSGAVVSSARTITFEVTGSYVHPILSLEATFDVPPGSNPMGSVNGNVNAARTEILSTVSGPDISGQVTFSRED